MPRNKAPSTLVNLASKVFANLALERIKELELKPEIFSDTFDNSTCEILEYFNALPSMVVHQIIAKSIESYVSDCKTCNHIDMVTCTLNNGHFVEGKCVVPRLASMYSFQVSRHVTHLDFSYLVNLGK